MMKPGIFWFCEGASGSIRFIPAGGSPESPDIVGGSAPMSVSTLLPLEPIPDFAFDRIVVLFSHRGRHGDWHECLGVDQVEG